MLLPRKYESADNRRPRRTHRTQQRNFFWKSYLQFFNLFTCIWSFGKSEQRKSDKKLWRIRRKRFEIGTSRAIQVIMHMLAFIYIVAAYQQHRSQQHSFHFNKHICYLSALARLLLHTYISIHVVCRKNGCRSY